MFVLLLDSSLLLKIFQKKNKTSGLRKEVLLYLGGRRSRVAVAGGSR